MISNFRQVSLQVTINLIPKNSPNHKNIEAPDSWLNNGSLTILLGIS